jgi:archaemetzincin
MRCIIILLLSVVLLSCNDSKSPSQTIVDIQPLNNFSSAKTKLAVQIIEEKYGFHVKTLTTKEIPTEFITRRKGLRYQANKIIAWLNTNTQNDSDFTIGLTDVEICTDKKDKLGIQKKPESKYRDWAVFGLGYINRAGCVVSTKRLGRGQLGNTRFQKVVLHELGHNLGLPHCPNNCVMADAAETIKTVDSVPMELCKQCKAKVLD